jgi:hypothetical protein
MSALPRCVVRLAPAILLLLVLLPAGTSAAVRTGSGSVLRLSRPAHTSGCCALEIEKLSETSVSVTDSDSGFSATAGPFTLSRSRLPGYQLLWVWVAERNGTNIADALVSGPGNWLLRARDGLHSAFAAAPPHHSGRALAHVNALVADTDPENDGWIVFRFPHYAGPRFTLYWSDCRPRCNQSAGITAYAPVVDITVGNGRR